MYIHLFECKNAFYYFKSENYLDKELERLKTEELEELKTELLKDYCTNDTMEETEIKNRNDFLKKILNLDNAEEIVSRLQTNTNIVYTIEKARYFYDRLLGIEWIALIKYKNTKDNKEFAELEKELLNLSKIQSQPTEESNKNLFIRVLVQTSLVEANFILSRLSTVFADEKFGYRLFKTKWLYMLKHNKNCKDIVNQSFYDFF